jgi:hypothetical protein
MHAYDRGSAKRRSTRLTTTLELHPMWREDNPEAVDIVTV